MRADTMNQAEKVLGCLFCLKDELAVTAWMVDFYAQGANLKEALPLKIHLNRCVIDK